MLYYGEHLDFRQPSGQFVYPSRIYKCNALRSRKPVGVRTPNPTVFIGLKGQVDTCDLANQDEMKDI